MVPAITTEVALISVVTVDSSGSEGLSVVSFTERAFRVTLARKRRDLAQSAKEAVAAEVAVLEAELHAKRSASNTGSVGRFEDFERGSGNPSARAAT